MKERIHKQITLRYFKYFKHWRDFDLLTCILAMIGLILAVADYETRDWTMPTEIVEHINELSFVRLIISLLTLLAVVSLLFRVYLKTYWQDHKNAADFQNMLVKMQNAQRENEREPSKPTDVVPQPNDL